MSSQVQSTADRRAIRGAIRRWSRRTRPADPVQVLLNKLSTEGWRLSEAWVEDEMNDTYVAQIYGQAGVVEGSGQTLLAAIEAAASNRTT